MQRQKRPFEVVTKRRRRATEPTGLFDDVAGFADAVQSTRGSETTEEAPGKARPAKDDGFFRAKPTEIVPERRVLIDRTQPEPVPFREPEPERKPGRPRKLRSEEDEALRAAKAKHRARARRAELPEQRAQDLATAIGASVGESSTAVTFVIETEADDVANGAEQMSGEDREHARVRRMLRKNERAILPLGKRWQRHLPRRHRRMRG